MRARVDFFCDTCGVPKQYEESDYEQEQRIMWRRIAVHLGTNDWAKVSWRAIYRAMQTIGYPLNNEQEKLL